METITPILTRESITATLMDAQADLQTALGVLRVSTGSCTLPPETVETRMAEALTKMQALLDGLGSSLYRNDFDAYADRIAALRTRAADPQRDAYTVSLGQLAQLGCISEETWRECIDRPRAV